MKAKILLGSLITSMFILVSCGNWVDPGINVDPTAPENASLDVILPTTQAGMAYVIGGDFYRYVGMFTQHLTGKDRQSLGIYNYQIDESTIDNAWTAMYTGPMEDFKIMIQQSATSPHYKGIAEVLMALSLGAWTDILGDIPYSEALTGQANLRPKYDSQEQIYNTIQSLLSTGITDLGAATSDFKPGGDDFIYGGKLANWMMAAHALKARYYLHLKKYNEALTEIASAFTDNSTDLQFNFKSKETEANPFYQFNDQRGDVSMGGYLMTMMNTLNDPRRPMFAELDDNDEYSNTSFPGPFYGSINSPVVFISYAEIKFIEAECQFRLSSPSAAYAAYLAAVQASLEKFGVAAADVTTYMADPSVAVGEAALTLETIMNQKYIAMFYNCESWSDWRRTGFPVLTPTTGSQIPRRIFYPQSERLFNGPNLLAVPDYVNSTDFKFSKMWWDKMWP